MYQFWFPKMFFNVSNIFFCYCVSKWLVTTGLARKHQRCCRREPPSPQGTTATHLLHHPPAPATSTATHLHHQPPPPTSTISHLHQRPPLPPTSTDDLHRTHLHHHHRTTATVSNITALVVENHRHWTAGQNFSGEVVVPAKGLDAVYKRVIGRVDKINGGRNSDRNSGRRR